VYRGAEGQGREAAALRLWSGFLQDSPERPSYFVLEVLPLSERARGFLGFYEQCEIEFLRDARKISQEVRDFGWLDPGTQLTAKALPAV